MNDVYTELELASGSEVDFLEHHGILGMHWGVRRYQNADGTYTKAGLERYNDSHKKYVEAKSAYKKSKAALGEAYNSPYGSHHKKEYKIEKRAEKNAAKKEYKQAKKNLQKSYDDLQKDYNADKGREIVDRSQNQNVSNELLEMNKGKKQAAKAALGFAVLGKVKKAVGNKTLGNVMYGLAAGEALTAAVLKAEERTTIRDLDAYYERKDK